MLYDLYYWFDRGYWQLFVLCLQVAKLGKLELGKTIMVTSLSRDKFPPASKAGEGMREH